VPNDLSHRSDQNCDKKEMLHRVGDILTKCNKKTVSNYQNKTKQKKRVDPTITALELQRGHLSESTQPRSSEANNIVSIVSGPMGNWSIYHR
jgi:hypothetical protein